MGIYVSKCFKNENNNYNHPTGCSEAMCIQSFANRIRSLLGVWHLYASKRIHKRICQKHKTSTNERNASNGINFRDVRILCSLQNKKKIPTDGPDGRKENTVN